MVAIFAVMSRFLSCSEWVMRLNVLVSWPISSLVEGMRGIGERPSVTC